MAPCLLCFQKSIVFVNCGSADVANPCQLADIQLLALVGGIVPKDLAHFFSMQNAVKERAISDVTLANNTAG